MFVMSLKYTSVTQSIVYLIVLICVATMHHKTTVDKNKKQTAISVILKSVHQTWYELRDPEQG